MLVVLCPWDDGLLAHEVLHEARLVDHLSVGHHPNGRRLFPLSWAELAVQKIGLWTIFRELVQTSLGSRPRIGYRTIFLGKRVLRLEVEMRASFKVRLNIGFATPLG